MLRRHTFYVISCVITIALMSSCAPKRYFGRAIVLQVNQQDKMVTLSHEPIPNFMDAMVMPFSVRDSELLAGVQRGQRVHFRLAVDKKVAYLEHLRIVSAAPVDPSTWQSAPLSQVVKLGEPIPDFELTDHRGTRVSMSQFRGKVVAVNFIYTRCPLPDYCPRMTNNFTALRDRFARQVGTQLVLLTLTFDPQYDTAEVLRNYAKSYRTEVPGWYFLTGDWQEIARVCGLFGVEFWPDEGMITHNLQTGLIDREGRLAANVEGKDYSPKQLGDLIELLLQGN